MLTLTDQDNGRRLPVHVRDLLEIYLTENATAGYRWAPDSYDTVLLELVDETTGYPNVAVGSGGKAIFRFQIVGVGSSKLTLKCWRHWEGTGSIIQRFAVTIDAAPAPRDCASENIKSRTFTGSSLPGTSAAARSRHCFVKCQ